MSQSANARLMALPGVRGLMIASAVSALLTALLIVAQWRLVADFVDAVFLQRRAPDTLVWTLLAVALALLVRAAVQTLRETHALRIAARVKREVRARLLRQLVDLGPGFVTGQREGELTETVVGGADRLEGYVGRFVPSSVVALVVPGVLAGVVLWIDPVSGVILLFTGPVMVVMLWLVGTQADVAAKTQWLTLGRLGARFASTLRGLGTLVAYGVADRRLRDLNAEGETYREATLKVLRVAFLSGFVLEFGATLCTALVAVTVGVRLFEGHLPFERALFVLLLAPEFFAPLRTLGADHHASLEARASATRIFEVLDARIPASGGQIPAPGTPHVTLEHVDLKFGKVDVLRDLNLDVRPGEHLALVGASGSGKSSVVALVLGFNPPGGGAVRVDGVDLADLDRAAWRGRVAYVPQRPYLFPGSVRDNLTLGRPDADDAAVERAARAAGAHDFIGRLPRGYDTPLGEDGVRLSGGERLRLALARAFLRDAPLLVLDEVTAHLDDETEADVLSATARLARGRTVLSITHRPAPLLHADRVVRLTAPERRLG